MTSATGKKKPSLCCRFSFCFFFSVFLLLLPRSGSSSVRRLCDQLNDGPPEAAIVVVVVVAFVETNCTHSLIAICALPPQATKSRFRHVTVIAVSQLNRSSPCRWSYLSLSLSAIPNHRCRRQITYYVCMSVFTLCFGWQLMPPFSARKFVA